MTALTNTLTADTAQRLYALETSGPEYAVQFVDLLLDCGIHSDASDLHLQPTPQGIELRWRIDGVLQHVGTFPSTSDSGVVARLKILADLLTYHTDSPQEGRIRAGTVDKEMRVSTFPTIHGERAVVRIFGGGTQLQNLADLGFPEQVLTAFQELLLDTSGAILVAGPAGSGKTTTLYCALRHIVSESHGGRSIVTLEDPVESAIEGVVQSQIHPPSDFDFATGLRSLMRQDPEVIMVGEIRDRETAEVAFQAALTGQLVLSSFHAASAASAISRLSDMGIAPYLLRSGLRAIVYQRLVRRLCDCATPGRNESDHLGLPVRHGRIAAGCAVCDNRGYRGRILLSEMLSLDDPAIGRAVLSQIDARDLEATAVRSGMITRWQRACEAIESGETSAVEVRRVLGCGFAAEQEIPGASE